MEGRRQLGLLSGEAGIGKTTVVDLFVASLPPARERWGGAGAVSTPTARGTVSADVGSVGAVRAVSAPRGAPECAQRYAPTWLVHLPGLLGDGERERLQRQLAGVTPARMLRELAEALEVLTTSIPLVLVLEDLHWSDVSTVNLLTYLAQRREGARFLLLGTYCPVDVVVRAHPLRGVLQELRGRGLCDELALELLLSDDVEAYMAARLGGEVTAELVVWLYHQTEGNALFLVNMLEHLVEQGVVKQQGDQWTLRAPPLPAARRAGRPGAPDHQTARDARPGRAARPGSGQCGGRRICHGSGGGGAGCPRDRCRRHL